MDWLWPQPQSAINRLAQCGPVTVGANRVLWTDQREQTCSWSKMAEAPRSVRPDSSSACSSEIESSVAEIRVSCTVDDKETTRSRG